MIIGKVKGHVWATRKNYRLDNTKLLIIQHYHTDFTPIDDYSIAVDTVGAGAGEYVLLARGNSARQTDFTKNMPIDAVITAIIDEIHLDTPFEDTK